MPFEVNLSRRSLLSALALLPATRLLRGQQANTTFSADVKVVNLLATVRDKQGQIVRDLTKDDFLLDEDGRRESSGGARQRREPLPQRRDEPAVALRGEGDDNAEAGHDENISLERARETLGKETATTLRDRSLAVYAKAAEYARRHGILIADTKFEWGEADGRIFLIDEVLTPDSSRFWPIAAYEPGHGQPSFDKQYVRDYLEQIRWNKQPPVPSLPPDVVERTRDKYREAFERLTGRRLA